MADPLTLLRQFNISKKNIVEREEQIIFETISFLKTAKTNYVIGRYILLHILIILSNLLDLDILASGQDTEWMPCLFIHCISFSVINSRVN